MTTTTQGYPAVSRLLPQAPNPIVVPTGTVEPLIPPTHVDLPIPVVMTGHSNVSDISDLPPREHWVDPRKSQYMNRNPIPAASPLIPLPLRQTYAPHHIVT